MQIIVSGHQVNVTPALRDYVEAKLGRIVRRFDPLLDAAVVLTVEKLFHKAEATMHCAANKTIQPARLIFESIGAIIRQKWADRPKI